MLPYSEDRPPTVGVGTAGNTNALGLQCRVLSCPTDESQMTKKNVPRLLRAEVYAKRTATNDANYTDIPSSRVPNNVPLTDTATAVESNEDLWLEEHCLYPFLPHVTIRQYKRR